MLVLNEYQNLILTLNKDKMRKLILILVVIASLTACTGKAKTQDATATDTTAVTVDSVATTVDTTSVDTTSTK